jgi:hypothetical protein
MFGDPSLTIRFPEGPLLTTPAAFYVAPLAGTLTVPFTIKNVGPIQATFAISAKTNIIDPLPIDEAYTDITLASGASLVIPISIAIGVDHPERRIDVIMVSATQIAPEDPRLNAKASVTFQVFKPSVFFPIIYR